MLRTSSARRNARLVPLSALLGLMALAGQVMAQGGKKEAVVDVRVSTIPGITNIDKIDELVAKNWEANKLEPAHRCTDYEFIRRASLDIIGRIATVEEIREYMKEPESKRRSILIEKLVNSDEFADNFANLWTTLLMTRTLPQKIYKEQMKAWLVDELNAVEEEKKSEQPKKGTAAKDEKKTDEPKKGTAAKKADDPKMKVAPRYNADWSQIAQKLISASGITNENAAVNFVLHHMGDPVAAADQANLGRFDMIPVTSRTTRLFLGLRTQCTQCHDHPFNTEWGQNHFWGINAFFRQTEGDRPVMGAPNKKKDIVRQLNLRDTPSFNVKGIVPYERRSGVLLYIDATFLDKQKVKASSKLTRRQELANFVVKSPYFSKAYVNRMWGHFFGKSFTKDALDDFGEHNPVTNEELLELLSKDWAEKYNHNPRTLVRWICNSKAYGLSTQANKTNDKPEDEVFFARMLEKPLTPEQMFESMMTATQAQGNKEERQAVKERWLDDLVKNFGNDEGEEGTFSGTIVQALILMNGKDVNQAISDEKTGTVANVLKKRAFSKTAAVDAVHDLFLAGLNRPATKTEIAMFVTDPKLATAMRRLPRVPSAESNQQAFWTRYYQDVFWAILNSNEFILNH